MRFHPPRFHLPWLHPQRAEVLAALGLALRMRQPLAEGFARLAFGDALLRPWSARLHQPLSDGTRLDQALWRERLLSKRSAMELDRAAEPVAEFILLTHESLQPLRGLMLICWFPLTLSIMVMIPFTLADMSRVAPAFERIYRQLGITLPTLTEILFSGRGGGFLIFFQSHHCDLADIDHHQPAADGAPCAAPVVGRNSSSGRHAGNNRGGPRRQRRPEWDRAWRTWRILTRWRAVGPNWKTAARATTAADLLHALGVLPVTADHQALIGLRDLTHERLRQALSPAVDEAKGLLLVGFACGSFLTVIAFFLPFIKVTGHMGIG